MSDLWDWAVQAYALPGAEARLLSLQDEHDQCVSYLLWAAWMGRAGGQLSAVLLKDAADVAGHWDRTVVDPLRIMRRSLRGGEHPALHEQVLAAELSAERVLLERLEALAPTPKGTPDMAGALGAAAKAWAPPAPQEAIDALVRILC